MMALQHPIALLVVAVVAAALVAAVETTRG